MRVPWARKKWCEAELNGCGGVYMVNICNVSIDSPKIYMYASWSRGKCCVWEEYNDNSMMWWV